MYASTAAKFYNLNYMWTAANFSMAMRQYGHKLSTVALKQLSFVSRIGVGAGKILQRNFAQILLNLTKKYFKKKSSKKKLFMSIRMLFRINLGTIIFKSKHVGHHLCSDFQGVLDGSQKFCLDFREFFPDFMGLFPDFH